MRRQYLVRKRDKPGCVRKQQSDLNLAIRENRLQRRAIMRHLAQMRNGDAMSIAGDASARFEIDRAHQSRFDEQPVDAAIDHCFAHNSHKRNLSAR